VAQPTKFLSGSASHHKQIQQRFVVSDRWWWFVWFWERNASVAHSKLADIADQTQVISEAVRSSAIRTPYVHSVHSMRRFKECEISIQLYLPTRVLSNITNLSDTADAVKNVLPVVNYEVRIIQTTTENISVWTLTDHGVSLLHDVCFKIHLRTYLRTYFGHTMEKYGWYCPDSGLSGTLKSTYLA